MKAAPTTASQPQPDEPDEPAPGGYAACLNPFVYSHSLLDIGDCATNDLPIDQLTKDLRKPKTTPQFAFVAPNLCHSGLGESVPRRRAQRAPRRPMNSSPSGCRRSSSRRRSAGKACVVIAPQRPRLARSGGDARPRAPTRSRSGRCSYRAT